MSCATAPCCTHVPLHTFQIRSLRDLDHAIYLLNFERIVLGLSPTGDWSVYYKFPCRFLDRGDAGNYLCSIHGTPLQPQICVNYSPYSCWYKRALTPTVSGEFLTIDRRRMEAVVDRLVFDDDRNIVETPDWEALISLLGAMPLDPDFDPPPEVDPVFERWLEQSAVGVAATPRPQRRGYQDFADPCGGCAAYCCKTLVFPHGRPVSRRNVDYLQFLLGFPGIEIGVNDGDWQILVRSRCRHLSADNRCGVYGQPERPSLCRYFDATSCSYLVQFGQSRPRGFLRVRLEQFFWMVESMRFDDDGALIELSTTERMREIVEQRWLEAVEAADDGAAEDAAPASME
jgi:Fe-S-cluster containining protein